MARLFGRSRPLGCVAAGKAVPHTSRKRAGGDHNRAIARNRRVVRDVNERVARDFSAFKRVA